MSAAQVFVERYGSLGVLLYLAGLGVAAFTAVAGAFISSPSAASIGGFIHGLLVLALIFIVFREKSLLERSGLGGLREALASARGLLRLAPLILAAAIVMNGVALVGVALPTAISFIAAGVLGFLLVLVAFYGFSFAVQNIVPLLVLVEGILLSVAGFLVAGSSMANLLMFHAGIAGIAVTLLGLAMLVPGLAGQGGEALGAVVKLLLAIALVVGSALNIYDSARVLGAINSFTALGINPAGLTFLSSMNLLAGIVCIIAALVFLLKTLLDASSALQARAPPAPPPPPPPPS